MRKVRTITFLGVLLLLALSACTAAELSELQEITGEISLDDNQVEFTGALEALDEASLTVEGQLLSIVPESEIASGLVLGDLVKVEAAILADGSLVALEVKPFEDASDDSDDEADEQDDEIEFTGEISAMETGSWTIADQPVAILDSTEIHGEFTVGDIVKVHAYLAEDGTLTAREIEPGEAGDMDDSESDDDSEGFELYGTAEAISDTEWTIAGVVVAVDAGTDIETGIVTGDWVKAEGMVLEDGTFLAMEISLEEMDDEGSGKLEFVGLVEAIGDESWTVAGREVPISSETEIEDGIEVGDLVKIELQLNADGSVLALEIDLFDMDDDDMDDNDYDDEDDDDYDDDDDEEDDDDHEEDDHEEDDHEDDD
jgi:hypothetical protein